MAEMTATTWVLRGVCVRQDVKAGWVRLGTQYRQGHPQMPSIPADTPLGTTVATVTATWSDGSPFTGTLGFATPYLDDGGTFALSCTACATANLVVNPLGRGVSGDGGSVQQVTVEAVQ